MLFKKYVSLNTKITLSCTEIIIIREAAKNWIWLREEQFEDTCDMLISVYMQEAATDEYALDKSTHTLAAG